MSYYEWAPKVESCCCCFAIVCPYDADFHKEIVNTITLRNIEIFDTGYMMQIKHHSHLMKGWCVLSKFLFYNSDEKTITIPVITSTFCSIKAGEPLCHIMFKSLSEAYDKILKGIYFYFYFFKQNKIIFY